MATIQFSAIVQDSLLDAGIVVLKVDGSEVDEKEVLKWFEKPAREGDSVVVKITEQGGAITNYPATAFGSWMKKNPKAVMQFTALAELAGEKKSRQLYQLEQRLKFWLGSSYIIAVFCFFSEEQIDKLLKEQFKLHSKRRNIFKGIFKKSFEYGLLSSEILSNRGLRRRLKEVCLHIGDPIYLRNFSDALLKEVSKG